MISDDVEFSPTEKKLIDPQRNIAGMVIGGFHDRAFGKSEKVANRKSNHGYFEAKPAGQPRHRVE
jgi:hypothetical protein